MTHSPLIIAGLAALGSCQAQTALRALAGAGLTPYQALVAATRGPAEYLGGSAQWGTIETGKRADFVLVSGNPLEDIANTARIRGVAVGGRWLDRAALDRMIATGARATSAEP